MYYYSLQNQNYSCVEPKLLSAVDTFEASQDINRVVYSDIKPTKPCSGQHEQVFNQELGFIIYNGPHNTPQECVVRAIDEDKGNGQDVEPTVLNKQEEVSKPVHC